MMHYLPICGAVDGTIALLFSVAGITAQIVARDEKLPCSLPSPHGSDKDGTVSHEDLDTEEIIAALSYTILDKG